MKYIFIDKSKLVIDLPKFKNQEEFTLYIIFGHSLSKFDVQTEDFLRTNFTYELHSALLSKEDIDHQLIKSFGRWKVRVNNYDPELFSTNSDSKSEVYITRDYGLDAFIQLQIQPKSSVLLKQNISSLDSNIKKSLELILDDENLDRAIDYVIELSQFLGFWKCNEKTLVEDTNTVTSKRPRYWFF